MKKVSLMKKMGITLMAGLFLVGCISPGESVVADASLELLNQLDTVYFSLEGKSERTIVSVSANLDWVVTVHSADPAVNWVNVDKASGPRGRAFLGYTVNPNPYTQPRECDLVISGTGVNAGTSKKIHIIQEGSFVSVPEMETEPETKIIAATTGDEGDIMVVRATRPWTVASSAAWLKLDPLAGDPVNIDPNQVDETAALAIHWIAEEFDGAEAREAVVTFTITHEDGGVYTRTVTVRQEPVYLTLVSTSPDPIKLHQEGTTATPAHFVISTNRSWETSITYNEQDGWITALTPNKGEDGEDQTVELTVIPNPEFTSRTAVITVTAGVKTVTVNVEQDGAGIVIPAVHEGYTFPAKASVKEFANITVDNGEPWTATTEADWLTLAFGEGYDSALPEGDGYNDVLKATAQPNPKAANRSAVITIKSGEMTKTFTVKQEAAAFTITSTPALSGSQPNFTYEVAADGTVALNPLSVLTTNNLPWNIKVEPAGENAWIVPGTINLQGHDLTKPYETKVSFLPNPTDAVRTGKITIFTGAEATPDMTFEIAVTQKAAVFTVSTLDAFPPQGSYQSMDDVDPMIRKKTVTVTTDNNMPITYSKPIDKATGNEAAWLTFTQTATGFELLCDRNPDAALREAVVTVTCGEMKEEVTVVQNAAGDLALDNYEITLKAESGHIANVGVTNYSSNNIEPVHAIKYVTGEDWLDVGLSKTDGYQNYRLLLTTLTPNTTLQPREAVVEVSCGNIKKELVVKQRKMKFEVDPVLDAPYGSVDNFTLENYPHTYFYNSIEPLITTNIPEVPWTVELKAESDTDAAEAWFDFEKVDQEHFKVFVRKYNDRAEKRSATLVFTQGDQTHEFTFTQVAGSLDLQQTELKLDAYAYTNIMWKTTTEDATQPVPPVAINGFLAGTGSASWTLADYALTQDFDLNVKEGQDWLKVVRVNGDIRLDAQANPTDKERKATVEVSFGRTTKSFTVTQKAAELVLATTPWSLNTGSEVTGPDRRIDLSIEGSPTNEVRAGNDFYITGTNLLDITVESFDGTPAAWFKTTLLKAQATLHEGKPAGNLPQVGEKAYLPGDDRAYTLGYMNGDIQAIIYNPTAIKFHHYLGGDRNVQDLAPDTLYVHDIKPNADEKDIVYKMRFVLGDKNGEHVEYPVTFRQKAASLVVEHIMEVPVNGDNTVDGILFNDVVKECTGYAWEVAADWMGAEPWFAFAKDGAMDLIIRNVEPNPTNKVREMDLVYTSGNIVKRTRVSQAAATLELLENPITLPGEGTASEATHTNVVSVNNGMQWTISQAQDGWFEVYKNGETGLIFLNVKKNEALTDRAETLTVTCGEMTAQLIVRQNPVGELQLSGTGSYNLPADGNIPAPGVVSPITTADLGWTVGTPSDDWIKVIKEGNNSLRIAECKPNPTHATRSLVVPIEYGGQVVNFTFVQEAGELNLRRRSNASLVTTFSANNLNGGDYNRLSTALQQTIGTGMFSVTTDLYVQTTYEPNKVTVEVQDPADTWIQPFFQGDALRASVQANNTGDTRTAVLVIRSGEMTLELTVTQEKATFWVVHNPYPGPETYVTVASNAAQTLSGFCQVCQFNGWPFTPEPFTEFTVDASTEPWISVARVGNDIVVHLQKNDTGVNRSYQIVVRNGSDSEVRTWVITQEK